MTRAEAVAVAVEAFRGLEVSCRTEGMFEHANAARMYADAFEEGSHPSDLAFDSGVFDKHCFSGEGEFPYLVEESPRLKPCACGAAIYFAPRDRSTGAGLMMARRNGKYVCKACFDAPAPEGGAR